MAPVEWRSPATLADALAAMGPGAVVKAGGIDVLDRCKEGLDQPTRLVSLGRVAELGAVREEEGAIELGPLVTLARVSEDPLVRARLPALAHAAGRAATPNLRNLATLGGNLLQRPRCWYFRQAAFACLRKGGSTCFAVNGRNGYHALFENGTCAAVHPSDAATPLVAYGARARIASPAGTRELPLEEVFVRCEEDVGREHRLGPDELLIAIRVPVPPQPARSVYLRQAQRDSSDWPLGAVAVALELKEGTCRRAAVVLGAAAIVPWRARAAEGALVGRRIDEHAASVAAVAALEGATPLAENGYKVAILETLVRRAVLAAAEGA